MDTSRSCRSRRCKNPCPSSYAPSEDRDWASLPDDILLDIFLRLGSGEILWGVEAVCKAWRRVTVEEPKLWRHIHITDVPEWLSIETDFDVAVCDAVDRSAGICESFSGPWDDESLLYLAERAPSLKSLRLFDVEDASYEVLIEAIKKLPLLEDIDISPLYEHRCESDKLFESICKARPLLKNIKLRFIMPYDYIIEEAVLEECCGDIHTNPMMRELRSLEFFNCMLTSENLSGILDNCPLLESLHITGVFVDGTMDEQLQAKCARVKNLTLPSSDDEDEECEDDEESDDDDDVEVDDF